MRSLPSSSEVMYRNIEPSHAVRDKVDLSAFHIVIGIKVFLEVPRAALDRAGGVEHGGLGYEIAGPIRASADVSKIHDRRAGKPEAIEAENPMDENERGFAEAAHRRRISYPRSA